MTMREHSALIIFVQPRTHIRLKVRYTKKFVKQSCYSNEAFQGINSYWWFLRTCGTAGLVLPRSPRLL